jgi:hypothetical protein
MFRLSAKVDRPDALYVAGTAGGHGRCFFGIARLPYRFSAFARSGPCSLGNSNGGGRAGNTSNSYNNRLQSEGRVRGNHKIDLGGTSQP